MLRNYTFPLFLLVLWAFSSCEEPVDFEIDEQASIVVNSNFTANQDLQVVVSKTQSITSKGEPEFVENATITVFSNQELVEILEFVGDANPPYYRSNILNPVPGEVYTIKVDVIGFETVTGTTSIPLPVAIKDVIIEPTYGKDLNDKTTVNFIVSVTIDDPVDIDNFYHIYFRQELIPYTLVDGDTIASDDVNTWTNLEMSLVDINFPAEKYFDGQSFLIKDDLFNGIETIMQFKGYYSYDESAFLPGNFIVELRTVSQAYYDYHSSLNLNYQQTGNNNSDLSNETVIVDNITNGEGIFAGYSSHLNLSKFSN